MWPMYTKKKLRQIKGNPFRLNENLTSYNLIIKFYYKFSNLQTYVYAQIIMWELFDKKFYYIYMSVPFIHMDVCVSIRPYVYYIDEY